ncbi:MAG: YebC/PmpR family DNA-binding transcriptional regulator [Patescibacteria group bacterium]|nr:YebC/PmpR family DNA-binding transcriptional regulator [Patescibacteria group bacterium]
MSGHSKWSTIKHKKAINDAKRANIFTKLAKDVTIAARDGGDPEMNFKLRMAIDKARSMNMPKDNIERAIKSGTGELKEGAQIEEILYEAYGPGQVAILIKTATDNKNRTLSEVRNILNKNGGKPVEGGGVSWQFEQKGVIEVELGSKDEESVEMLIIESGADDYELEDKVFVVYTKVSELQKVKEALERGNLKIQEASLAFIPKDTVSVDCATREKYENLLEVLDEQDDVVDVFDNLG